MVLDRRPTTFPDIGNIPSIREFPRWNNHETFVPAICDDKPFQSFLSKHGVGPWTDNKCVLHSFFLQHRHTKMLR